ncbi:hypothetical protein [Nitrosovibrio sp. Nv4]|uniref:hypothetical protein n=1 Tax=Nitrosovibrio sp. Nv4 TaxID=1945880 RepID=UPI000BC7F861|nr:hypothetical protein [Nitrosovibrio sp. Nv4]SOD40562.1 hypothetical protein SAMN06298226_0834 [Nitrosovibrio sp. Nv4]
MANQTKVALAPVISVADNELLTVQNSLCEASFIVHFCRGMFFRAMEGGDGIELSSVESLGFIHLMDDLSNRLENLVSDLDECREGAHHG